MLSLEEVLAQMGTEKSGSSRYYCSRQDAPMIDLPAAKRELSELAAGDRDGDGAELQAVGAAPFLVHEAAVERELVEPADLDELRRLVFRLVTACHVAGA